MRVQREGGGGEQSEADEWQMQRAGVEFLYRFVPLERQKWSSKIDVILSFCLEFRFMGDTSEALVTDISVKISASLTVFWRGTKNCVL